MTDLQWKRKGSQLAWKFDYLCHIIIVELHNNQICHKEVNVNYEQWFVNKVLTGVICRIKHVSVPKWQKYCKWRNIKTPALRDHLTWTCFTYRERPRDILGSKNLQKRRQTNWQKSDILISKFLFLTNDVHKWCIIWLLWTKSLLLRNAGHKIYFASNLLLPVLVDIKCRFLDTYGLK